MGMRWDKFFSNFIIACPPKRGIKDSTTVTFKPGGLLHRRYGGQTKRPVYLQKTGLKDFVLLYYSIIKDHVFPIQALRPDLYL